MKSMNKTLVFGAAIVMLAGGASATPRNGVANASLTELQGGGTVAKSSALEFSDTSGKGVVLLGWTNAGYNFVYMPGTADVTTDSQVLGQNGGNYLWGPGDGSDNGFTAESPTGGSFLALDGAYEVGAISTTITGMTAGKTYVLSFDYAGAQQHGYNGATTETVKVTIGGTTYPEEPVLDNATHGFTGWQSETIKFVASSSSEALSFLAVGTPGGEPPFTLLSDISVPVPEPAAWTLMIAGFGGLGLALRNRRRATVV
jgi:hypothetical protein